MAIRRFGGFAVVVEEPVAAVESEAIAPAALRPPMKTQPGLREP